MKFSLCHPSRGRVTMAYETRTKWLANASGQHDVEHILSIDSSDPNYDSYIRVFEGAQTEIEVNPNRHCVDATNAGAKLATGDILIYLSDDFDCPQNWDLLLAEIAAKATKPEYLIWVNDGGQGRNTVITIPIMSRALYEALGYLYHPDYPSMWVDVDLWNVCNLRRCLIDAKQLLFKHNHWSVNRQRDATDNNHDSPEKNRIGLEIFNRRKAEGFKTEGVYR